MCWHVLHENYLGFDPQHGLALFFFSLSLYPCITAYGLPSLVDNSKYVAALLFKACTKEYVVNSCLANPDNEAVSHSATCSQH